uniref:Uncharacterized protein n=2 Tax=Triticum TaxID=4564 RepID=A0A8R7TCS9_TRIUA
RRRTARLVPRPSSARPQVRPRGDWRAASTAFGRIDAGRRGARRWPAVARCAERRRAPPLEVASRAQRHGPAASAAYGAWPLLSVPKALCLARRLPKTVSAEMGALPRQRFGRVGSFDVEAPDVPSFDIQLQRLHLHQVSECLVSSDVSSVTGPDSGLLRTLEDVISKNKKFRRQLSYH